MELGIRESTGFEMNNKLRNFARSEIKKGLHKLPERCHVLFKRMYSRDGDLSTDIDIVVDRMPVSKLDWAMQQVDRSVEIEGNKV